MSLASLDRDGAQQCTIEPRRQIRARFRERIRAPEARLHERLHFTIGVRTAGEHPVQRDAEREYVRALVRGRAGEQLRRHVAARARHLETLALVELPKPCDAEID